MLQTARATRAMVVAPHHLAAQAGLGVLREGGNAVEAMVAAAAAIAVVYPHMNGLGGDNFWLLSEPGKPPVAIDACGPAAALASIDHYRGQGHAAIPSRGPLAALTVAGAVAGWAEALKLGAEWGGRMPVSRLLADAIHYAKAGAPVTGSLATNTRDKHGELGGVPGWRELFLPGGAAPAVGALLPNPKLAAALDHLVRSGLDDFYRGDLARSLAGDLGRAGSPLRLGDLESYWARRVTPLSTPLRGARAYNLPPPTQGLASLMILGIFERLGVEQADGFDYVHGLVEATKQAFMVRDANVTDPAFMSADLNAFLSPQALDERAGAVDMKRALAWPRPVQPGDTVWLGAIDDQGRAVSFIQSLYWEFGSGLVLPETGIMWQNRGTSFALTPGAMHELKPGRKPFHTIQPALAVFDDGRVMPYGTMGGEGQPQTQAMILTRYARFGRELQQAVTAPRWLLGRTWGAETANLRIENRFAPEVIEALAAVGHDVEVVGPFDAVMGHAGALVRHTTGVIEGAADPRGDGQAAGY